MIVVIEKHKKNNDFIQVKPLFAVDEFSYIVTFWRYALFEVILTSVTIIKLDFLCNFVLLQVTCWNRSIKTPNYEGHLESS